MNLLYLSEAQVVCYANDNDAFVPELWSREGLEILTENWVMAGLVHRDFEDEVADFGDVVNTRRPGQFKTRRKTDTDTIQYQDAKATNVRVPLDQHFYTSFIIKDGEASKSMADLVDEYLIPGVQTIARSADRALLGHVHKYLANRVGRLEALSSSNAKSTVLSAREKLNKQLAHTQGRNLVLSPSSETPMLETELFISAEKRGDGGTALEEARLGRILGFQTFMDQNTTSISKVDTENVEGTVTNAAAAGTTGSQAVTITGYVTNVGEFAVMAGDDQPTFVTATTNAAGDTTAVTLSDPLKFAVSASAAITVYKAADVKGAYAIGYSRGIVIDGYAAGKGPQVGQLLAFGTGASRRTYTVIEAEEVGSEMTVHLDRPLEVALADNDLAFPGPSGSLNLAFHRNALALVTRPLALPRQGSGVLSAVDVFNDIALRTTMQYDMDEQGTKVTLDILAGIAVLDTDLAVVMLG